MRKQVALQILGYQILGCVILLFACGCAVGPNYRKPTVNVPTVYRGASARGSSTRSSPITGRRKVVGRFPG